VPRMKRFASVMIEFLSWLPEKKARKYKPIGRFFERSGGIGG